MFMCMCMCICMCICMCMCMYMYVASDVARPLSEHAEQLQPTVFAAREHADLGG